MSSIKPYANKNAVKVIAFAVSFQQQLSTEGIDLFIQQLIENSFYKEEFDEIQPQQEFSMTIGTDGVHQQKESIGGVSCRKVSNGNIIWDVLINRNEIIVTCKEYSRWVHISNKFYSYLSVIFELINENISQITLEYLDEFEVTNDDNNWKEELFKQPCAYLTSYVLKSDDYWHVNQGFFSQLDGLEDKLLDNVRINYFKEPDDNIKNKINIVTQHTIRFVNSKKFEIDLIKNVFEIIHLHSKDIFENIIHDDVLSGFDRKKI